jgi:hypothetical protein
LQLVVPFIIFLSLYFCPPPESSEQRKERKNFKTDSSFPFIVKLLLYKTRPPSLAFALLKLKRLGKLTPPFLSPFSSFLFRAISCVLTGENRLEDGGRGPAAIAEKNQQDGKRRRGKKGTNEYGASERA